MKVINIAQRSHDWLQWRKTGVSASSASVLVGANPYKSLWRLWAEKTGRAVEADLSKNPHVRRGFFLEDRARQCCEKVLEEEFLLPACGQSSVNPLFLASFDGLTHDNIPAELKCPCEKVFQEVLAGGESSDGYKLYYPQVQHQIYVSDAPFGWLMFYGPENNGAHMLFKVQRDDSFLYDLEQRVVSFWRCVETDTAPERLVDRDLFTPRGEAAKRWMILAAEYRALEQQALIYAEKLRSIKSKMKDSQDGLSELMGDFSKGEFAGVSITRYLKKGAIDYDKFITERIEDINRDMLESYRREGSTQCRVTVTDHSMPREIIDPEIQKYLCDFSENDTENSYF